MKEIVLNKDEIHEICVDLGRKLEEKFKDSETIPVFVGVLKGATPFFMDLIREIHIPLALDFIQVTSFSGTSSTGVIHLKKDLSEDVTNRDLVIVEDIVDSGLTLNYVKQYLEKNHKPRSITVVCLFDKKPMRKIEFEADYVGVTLKENKFLCGYGFDYYEILRNIDFVFVPDEEDLKKYDDIIKNSNLNSRVD